MVHRDWHETDKWNEEQTNGDRETLSTDWVVELRSSQLVLVHYSFTRFVSLAMLWIDNIEHGGPVHFMFTIASHHTDWLNFLCDMWVRARVWTNLQLIFEISHACPQILSNVNSKVLGGSSLCLSDKLRDFFLSLNIKMNWIELNLFCWTFSCSFRRKVRAWNFHFPTKTIKLQVQRERRMQRWCLHWRHTWTLYSFEAHLPTYIVFSLSISLSSLLLHLSRRFFPFKINRHTARMRCAQIRLKEKRAENGKWNEYGRQKTIEEVLSNTIEFSYYICSDNSINSSNSSHSIDHWPAIDRSPNTESIKCLEKETSAHKPHTQYSLESINCNWRYTYHEIVTSILNGKFVFNYIIIRWNMFSGNFRRHLLHLRS